MIEWHGRLGTRKGQKRDSELNDINAASTRNKKSLYEVNHRISQIIEFLPDPTFAIDDAGRIIFWNKLMEEMTGVSSKDILGKSNYEYALPFYGKREPVLIDLVLKRDDEAEKKYTSFYSEGKSIYAEGMALASKRLLWGKASPMYDDQGMVIGAIESIRDVTERKNIERAHNDAIEQIVQLVDFLPDPTFAINLEKKVILWNKAMERLTGVRTRDILNSEIHEYPTIFNQEKCPLLVDFIVNPDLLKNRDQLNIKNNEDTLSFEGVVDFNGGKRYVWMQASPICDSLGNMVGAIETIRDITFHIEAQKQLIKEKDFCLSLIETSPAFFVAIGLQGETLWINRAMLLALGYSLDEALSRPYIETFVHQNDRRDLFEIMRGMQLSRESVVHENRVITKNGSILDVQWHGAPIYNDKGEYEFLFALGIDITENKCAEEALRENEERLRGMAANLPGIVYQFYARPNGEMGLYYVNDRSEEILGLNSDLKDFLQQFMSCLAKEDREAFLSSIREAIDTVSTWDFETKFIKPDGCIRYLRGVSQPVQRNDELIFNGVILDVTDRKCTALALHESEERFRTIFENALEGIFQTTPEGRFLNVNPALARMFGFSRPSEMIDSISNLGRQHYVNLQAREALMGTVKEQDKLEGFEAEFYRKDRSRFWASINIHAVRDTEGNILYFEGTNSDITERKHAEDGLKESEHMLSQIIDFLPDPTIALDLDGKIIVWNRAMEELTGVRASEMMGKSGHEHAIPLYGKRRPILVDLCLNPSEEDEKFYKVIKKEENLLIAEGEMLEKQFIIWGKASRIFSRKGNIIGAIETIRDISDRKATEKVLKLSEERYRTIFENTGTAMIIMGEDSTISLVNSQFEALSGYSRNEVEGKMKWVDFVSREKNQPEENIISGNNESYIMDKAEKRKYVLITKAVIPGTNSNIASLQDISDRKLAEEALRASEGRYRFLEENIHDIIWISDLALHFVYVSPSIERICGYRPEEIIGTTWRSYTRDESHKEMEEIFAEGMELAGAHDPSLLSRTWSLELQQIIRSGEVIWTESTISFLVDEEGSPIGLLGMTRDINARKRAEEQMELYEEHMKRSQKIEAIGTLAGGIAHDFNNILSAIIGFSEVARDELPSGSETRDKIDEVLKASERAKDLVKQILTFSRQVDVKPKPLAMHLIVKEVIKLLRSSIPSTIHIEQDIGADSGFILADPTQIHQVVMNLCINAYHAMLNTGGTLTISLNQVLLENEISFVPHDLAAGAYVKFEVRDTGCGMDDAIMHRIFDPFFTTKEKGLGTGLGLAIVHGIVKDLGGEILVSSTPGSGSVFKVLLPRFGIDPVDHANDLDLITEGNGERILLVDDEVAIAEFGKVMLEEIGYPTSSYTSSTEAFKAFCNDPDRFDVVITDQTMPEMRGDQLALEILKIRQDMAIIVMTGYSDMLDPQRAASLGIKGFIHKPFSRRIIATAIQKVLNIPK